ncbi:hypothetical protein MUB24_19845 [Lederbergia sp. NSJ-179]|uniref:hypothetical protein n=1 Tax=Lederbergia sp. NSJ-179 TaxID=2931402 RepID=UPI001FD5DC3E|nr:hypothetical protein [Lederbergia sp. NSJ-179]MCJ7843088.1 hypothetical protein [Lederbergia sp. NSJ-179]
MKIFIDYLSYIVIPLIFIWRGLRMRKMLRNEMIKGNVKPISYSWKMKIYPVLMEAWQERKMLKSELKRSLKK